MANTAERTKSQALRDTEVSMSLSLHVSRKPYEQDKQWLLYPLPEILKIMGSFNFRLV